MSDATREPYKVDVCPVQGVKNVTMVERTEVFGFYKVPREIMGEFTGQSLFDLFLEISCLTSIQWDDADDSLNVILVPKKPENAARLKALIGMLFNLLGIADGCEIEDSFSWSDHKHKGDA